MPFISISFSSPVIPSYFVSPSFSFSILVIVVDVVFELPLEMWLNHDLSNEVRHHSLLDCSELFTTTMPLVPVIKDDQLSASATRFELLNSH